MIKLRFNTMLLAGALLPAAFLITGCQTAETRTVDASGPQALNTGGINSQDWANAADQLVGSLLSSGALDKSATQPAILAVDRIINNTQLNIDGSPHQENPRRPHADRQGRRDQYHGPG